MSSTEVIQQGIIRGFPLLTERTTLRLMGLDDAEFVLRVFQEPGVIQGIGDRGMRTLDDAEAYIRDRVLTSYEKYGFGPFMIIKNDDGQCIGFAGLFSRDWLEFPDLGFCFLDSHTNQGFGTECSAALMAHFRAHGIEKILAIVSTTNIASKKLLTRLGFHSHGLIKTPSGEEIDLFATWPLIQSV